MKDAEKMASKAESAVDETTPEMLGPVKRFAQQYPLLTGAITYAGIGAAAVALLVGMRGHGNNHRQHRRVH